jgi:hypothetical protein
VRIVKIFNSFLISFFELIQLNSGWFNSYQTLFMAKKKGDEKLLALLNVVIDNYINK